MRIPRSTIVMAALTCIPFGLALHDYVTGKDKLAVDRDDYYDDYYDDREAYANYEAEQRAEEAREEAREAERKAELRAALDSLLGPSPGTLGPAFGSLTPGMTDTELGERDATTSALRTLARDRGLSIDFEEEEGLVQSIVITARDSDDDLVCEVLENALTRRWGEGQLSNEHLLWRDTSKHVRASFGDTYGCALSFSRYVDPEAWIGKTEGVVPMWAIGQPRAKLVKSLEPQRVVVSGTEYYLTWSAPGFGNSSSPTALTAIVSKGKVIAITARAVAPYQTHVDLQLVMEETFGAPKSDDDGALVWTKKPRITLTREDDATVVTVGVIPED